MKAGHKDKGLPGQSGNHLGPHRHDLPQPGARRQAFVAFAVNFAAQTANAFFLVL
jgi:hypothetical protein